MTGADDRRARLQRELRSRLADRGRIAPNQERLWFLHQIDRHSDAYHETVALRLDGDLDRMALTRAVSDVVARHAWLRSTIELREGHLRRTDVDFPGSVMQQVDLSDDEVEDWRSSFAGAAFARGAPLSRWGLARLGDRHHVLVIVIHHVACDGRSIELLLEQLGAAYDAAADGRPPPEVDVPDVDDVAAQITSALDALGPEAISRRAGEIGSGDPGTRLPRSGHGAPSTTIVDHQLSAADATDLTATLRRRGLTPFSVGAAAVASITAHYAGVEQVSFGVPTDLRVVHTGASGAVGFFTETALVGVPSATTSAIGDLADGIHRSLACAIDEPVSPHVLLAELINTGDAAPSDVPIQTYVGWMDDDEAATLGHTGPSIRHLEQPSSSPKADLNWTVIGDGHARFAIRLEFDAGRIGLCEAEAMVAHAGRLLAWAVDHLDDEQSTFDPLDDDERARLVRWAGVEDRNEPQSLDELWDRLGERHHPVLTLARARGESRSLTGSELLRRAERVAAQMQELGVEPGHRVGVSGHRDLSLVVAVLAVLRVGAAYVPLDTSLPAARVRSLLEDVKARAMIGPASAIDDVGDRPLVVIDPDDDSAAPKRRWPTRCPDDHAYVMFTSGSTGSPKGVVVHDAALTARCRSYQSVFGTGASRYLLHSALGFDASSFLYWVLLGGGHLIVPAEADASDPARLAVILRDQAVEATFAVPSLYQHVLDSCVPGELPALRQVAIGGEPFPVTIVERHTAVAPNATLLNVYGPTEVVVTSTAHTVVDQSDPTPIGRPHPGTLARVVDSHHHLVRPGAPGELVLSGPCVALGYHERPVETSAAFGGDDTGRSYRTGDIVRWTADGDLVFVGRRDRQIKLRGQRIEHQEIEATIAGLDGVEETASMVMEGSDGPSLVVVVTPATNAPRAGELRRQAATLLPRGWVPDRVLALDAIPRTSSWKLDLGAVRIALDAEVATDDGPSEIARGYTERAISANMASLLGVDDVDPTADFFELGGHSLLAARLSGMIAGQFDVEIPLGELIRDSSARQLARAVERGLVERWETVRERVDVSAVRHSGLSAPLAIVARDGETAMVLRHFLLHMDPDRPIWVVLLPTPPIGRTVPDLTDQGRRAAEALVETFPTGPVHVLGHSASGIVALEAARHLADRAGRVVLLDSYAPMSRVDLVRRPRWIAQEAVQAVLQSMRATRDRLVMARARMARTEPEPIMIRRLRDHQYKIASRRYRARAYGGDVVLVTCDESIEATEDESLGWRPWLPRVDLVKLSGDHHGVLLPPSVEHTVAAIDRVLAAAP